jgi:protein-tyrosine-phosphatase
VVLALEAAAADRTHLLGGLAAGLPPGEGAGIIDPYGGSDAAYERTFDQLRDAIRAVLPVVVRAAESAS